MRYPKITRVVAGILGMFLGLGAVAGVAMLLFVRGARMGGLSLAIGGALTARLLLYAAVTGWDAPLEEEEE